MTESTIEWKKCSICTLPFAPAYSGEHHGVAPGNAAESLFHCVAGYVRMDEYQIGALRGELRRRTRTPSAGPQ
jgi:hypothetical protein